MSALAQRTLSQVAAVLGVPSPAGDAAFAAVSTDTRSLQRGDLFVALHGPHFDGHDYLPQAAERGAVAAVVSRAAEVKLPLLRVEDTRLALGRLGAARRQAFPIPVIGITGSNGKTTVKEMTSAILQHCGGPVLATRGNLNNDIGMPLTLLDLEPQHRFAVIEMGANHPGEIAYLTALARPTVALITNAGPAHLEGFGTVEGVAHAKGEIYQGLSADGVAVINADDAYRGVWLAATEGHTRRLFGIDADDADVTADDIRAGAAATQFQLRAAEGARAIRLPLPGRHNVMNALAAAAACLAAGASMDAVAAGLNGLAPVAGRLQRRDGVAGAAIIDDTYNANPASLGAALAVLTASPGRHVLVLGDMGELGPGGEAMHRQAGEQARDAGVGALYAMGPLSRGAVEAFGKGAQHYDDAEALVAALRATLDSDTTVLVKGSRSMHMERVVAGLAGAQAEGG